MTERVVITDSQKLKVGDKVVYHYPGEAERIQEVVGTMGYTAPVGLKFASGDWESWRYLEDPRYYHLLVEEEITPEEIEEEARRLINGDRQADYGDASENYDRVAQVWSGIIGAPVTGRQALLCMSGLKLVRQSIKQKRDNSVDGVAYFLLEDGYVEKDERNRE